MRIRHLYSGVLLFLLIACSQEASQDEASTNRSAEIPPVNEDSKPNFIVIISDDLGIETLSSYGIGDVTAVTPNLDRLASSGVQFQNYWVQPTCSPTRATLLTGRYGFRTSILRATYPRNDLIDVEAPAEPAPTKKELHFSPRGLIQPGTETTPRFSIDFSKPPVDGLPPEEVTLPQLLKALPSEYSTAAVGKWHLADSRNGWLSAPNVAGFDYYSGLLKGQVQSHYQWLHVSQGEVSIETGYVDERTVEDGIQWLEKQAGTDNPWFLWVALVNPHTPITLPPEHLLTSDKSLSLTEEGLDPANTQPYAMAMIEAMDTLIGRLLNSVPESERDNTYIIFMGDNGTVKWAQPANPVDPDRAKGTVYEGGIRTPLIVAGPEIAHGATTEALTNGVDLLATVLELAGGSVDPSATPDGNLDSQSFVSVLRYPASLGSRDWIFSDRNTEGAVSTSYQYAIRDGKYKLVMHAGKPKLYNLIDDPWEDNDLLTRELNNEESEAYRTLKAYADGLLQSK